MSGPARATSYWRDPRQKIPERGRGETGQSHRPVGLNPSPPLWPLAARCELSHSDTYRGHFSVRVVEDSAHVLAWTVLPLSLFCRIFRATVTYLNFAPTVSDAPPAFAKGSAQCRVHPPPLLMGSLNMYLTRSCLP